MNIAFIQAKGNSERVPNKNLRILGDVPLFVHAIRNARNSENINKVVIDSDSEEILEIGSDYGAIPLKRPSVLATNEIDGNDLAYWQAMNYPNSNLIIQVVPTSPFIKSETIDKAIKIISEEKYVVFEKKIYYDSLFSVRKESFYIWKENRPNYDIDFIPNSNNLEKVIYETTGFYITNTKYALSEKRRINPFNYETIELSPLESIDINTEEDFKLAEIVWNGLQKK